MNKVGLGIQVILGLLMGILAGVFFKYYPEWIEKRLEGENESE